MPLFVAQFPWSLRVFIANSDLCTEVLSFGEYYDPPGICMSTGCRAGPRDMWGSLVCEHNTIASHPLSSRSFVGDCISVFI